MADAPFRFDEPLFYCPDLGSAGDITVAGGEAHHMVVQRLRRDDAVALFDGRGGLARGTIAAVAREQVRVQTHERLHLPPPAPQCDLYCAVPKGDRIAVLLDMATQLGMARFTPVAWQRGVAQPRAAAGERWRRLCLEACKQSRRLHLPEIADAAPLAQAVDAAKRSGARLVLAHPTASARAPSAADRQTPRLALFVGPEGGVTDEELELLRAEGAERVLLGDGILRIETAAVALLALAGR